MQMLVNGWALDGQKQVSEGFRETLDGSRAGLAEQPLLGRRRQRQDPRSPLLARRHKGDQDMPQVSRAGVAPHPALGLRTSYPVANRACGDL
jgi:hypothetical protein